MNGILKIIVVFILSISLCSIVKAQELSVYVYTQNVTCFGQSDGSAEANVSGGVPPYQYLWSTGATSESISNLAAGLYSVTVQDAATSIVTENFDIYEPSQLICSITTTPVICNGGDDGNAHLSVTGGVGGYLFQWSNGMVTSQLSGVSADHYFVTITDANDCQLIDEIYISEPQPIFVQTTGNPTICQGQMVEIGLGIFVGGTPPYTIIWENDIQGLTTLVQPMATTTYSAHIVDAVNCESETFEITVTVN